MCTNCYNGKNRELHIIISIERKLHFQLKNYKFYQPHQKNFHRTSNMQLKVLSEMFRAIRSHDLEKVKVCHEKRPSLYLQADRYLIVCVCMYFCVYMYVFVCVYAYMSVDVRWLYVFVFVYVCICLCIYLCVNAYMCVIHVYDCIYVVIYV